MFYAPRAVNGMSPPQILPEDTALEITNRPVTNKNHQTTGSAKKELGKQKKPSALTENTAER